MIYYMKCLKLLGTSFPTSFCKFTLKIITLKFESIILNLYLQKRELSNDMKK
jgi:hypothetical protein